MARWADVERSAPDLAGRVRAVLDAHRHKTLATLRRDGSPRISGTEAVFHDGDLWLGSMPGARKAHDLLRDPRLALHGAPVDPALVAGDAKLAGRAVPVTDAARIAAFLGQDDREPKDFAGSHFFVVDVTEVALTSVGDPADHLVVESWHEGRGEQRVERR